MYGKIKNKLPNLKVSLHTYNNSAYIFMLLLVFGLELAWEKVVKWPAKEKEMVE